MDAIGVEAARRLVRATAKLRDLEQCEQSQRQDRAHLRDLIAQRKRAVQLADRQAEQHRRHHEMLLHAIDELNQKNEKLSEELLILDEARQNLRSSYDAVVSEQSRLAVEIDKEAIVIQHISASIEAAEIRAQHDAQELKALYAKKAQTARAKSDADGEMLRLRVHANKANLASEYIETLLQ
jgi:chromosome segregation ATPase